MKGCGRGETGRQTHVTMQLTFLCTGSFHPPHPLLPSMQLTFLLDDVGIPKSYRYMPGFGVHTFRLINKAGKETFCKFHWVPKAGAWQGGEEGGMV
jgi:hypothetical protein